MVNYIKRIRLLLCFLFSPLLLLAQTDSLIEGIVADKLGKTLADVTVYSRNKISTATDANGHFKLKNPGKVIHFWKDGFAPYSLVLDPASTNIDVVLAPSDPRRLSECTSVAPGRKRLGNSFGWQFDIPVTVVRVRKQVDIDYIRYVIRPQKSKARIELWFTGMSPDPYDELIIGSRTFVQRALVKRNGFVGIDSRGESFSGKIWRYTVGLTSGAIYEDTLPDDAALFDEIIDSMCYIPYPSEQKTTEKH